MKLLSKLVLTALSLAALLPSASAQIAAGKIKQLGGIYSNGQFVDAATFGSYWNQIVCENASKWGSVEATRDTMNWTDVDAAYNYAKSNGISFRFHVLFWGAQQPAWMRDLSDAEQLEEIHEWLAAIAARYPDIDYLEVVNEAFHDQPDSTWSWLTFVNNATDPNCGNYKKALGGNGASGWEWVLRSFRLARQYFPNTKLMLNDYGIFSDGNATNQYVSLINLLKAENLVDIVAEQAHAFNTAGTSATTLTNNLNTIGGTGLPIWITELDIDGPSTDEAQRAEYERIFPAMWNNPYVIGITTWGYRPGLWRNTQGAYTVLSNGTERSAMTWLKSYVAGASPLMRTIVDTQPSSQTVNGGGNATFTVGARGNPAPTYQWQKDNVNIPGATSASLALNGVAAGNAGAYRCVVTNTYATVTTNAATLTVSSVAPAITTQPSSQSVTGGASVTFTAAASGVPTPTFQWKKGGVDIPGATSATYTIASTQASDQASYTVVATNSAGSATSGIATLTLTIPATFDVAGYYARNADVAAYYGSDQLGAWIHYYNFGLTEGRQFDSQFIVGEYLLLNTDLTNAFGSDLQAALLHWLTYGKPVEDRIGRVPIGFNVDSYLARYPDLAAAFGAITPTATRNVTVWNHYVDWGVREGRSDGDFEAYNYLATNADLAAVFGTDVESAAWHWYFYGRREGRRIPANFSVTGYRTRNPDVVTVWGNDLYGCWLHFRDTGVYEGRNYDDLFRVLEYRARYSDVQTAYGTNLSGVLNHWLFYGKPEGRLGRNP